MGEKKQARQVSRLGIHHSYLEDTTSRSFVSLSIYMYAYITKIRLLLRLASGFLALIPLRVARLNCLPEVPEVGREVLWRQCNASVWGRLPLSTNSSCPCVCHVGATPCSARWTAERVTGSRSARLTLRSPSLSDRLPSFTHTPADSPCSLPKLIWRS